MKNYKPTSLARHKSDFKRLTKYHKMEVLLDDGVHRHLRFRKGDSNCCGFDVVTFPGYLCITGDCGTFVFARLYDMFDFFRRSDGGINPHYWAEKLEAGKATEYSPRKFVQAILDTVKEYRRGHRMNRNTTLTWNDELLDLFGHLEGTPERDYDAVSNFQSDIFPNIFLDFWETDSEEYTSEFIFNLFSIVYAIDVYDKSKK